MTREIGVANAAGRLLEALATPAVLVDEDGVAVAWNAAAKERLGQGADLAGQPLDQVLGRQLQSAQRLELRAPVSGSLLVWPADEDGPGPETLALQREDAISRISGGIAHDLANPIAAILGLSSMVASDPSVPDDLRVLSRNLEESAARTHQIVRCLLDVARRRPAVAQLVSVGPLVRDVLELVTHPTLNMEVRVSVPDSLPQVAADPSQLRQAVLALLINAIEAQGGEWGKGAPQVHGRLLVSGREIDDDAGHRVRLAIEDGGPTLPEADRTALFSASGTARSGRDLVVARALIARAGGRLSVEPVAGGNRVVVELPAAGTALAELPAPAASAEPRAANPVPAAGDEAPVVLVCDDEPLVRGLLVRFMEREGLGAVEARSGREAIEILAARRVRMMVVDQGMPDITGVELYEAAVARQPDIASRFVVTSGDTATPELAEFAARTGVPILPKPFDHSRLAELVRRAVRG
jgi:signal transduction histidine kinase